VPTKTGIMELCIFCIIKGGYIIKITVLNAYMIKSIQLAIIQGFQQVLFYISKL
jgi:hypothetical protein